MSLLEQHQVSPNGVPKPPSGQEELILRTVENIEYIASSVKTAEGKGKIVLTDLRVVIISNVLDNAHPSLTIKHTSLRSNKFETVGLLKNSVRLRLEVQAEPEGGLGEGVFTVEVRSSKKDEFLMFCSALDKTCERTVNKSRTNPEDEFDLPAYGGPGPSSSNTTYIVAEQVPSDAPPGYEP